MREGRAGGLPVAVSHTRAGAAAAGVGGAFLIGRAVSCRLRGLGGEAPVEFAVGASVPIGGGVLIGMRLILLHTAAERRGPGGARPIASAPLAEAPDRRERTAGPGAPTASAGLARTTGARRRAADRPRARRWFRRAGRPQARS